MPRGIGTIPSIASTGVYYENHAGTETRNPSKKERILNGSASGLSLVSDGVSSTFKRRSLEHTATPMVKVLIIMILYLSMNSE